MLPESIELVIVTPERQLLRETVVEVTLPGGDGCLGILPGHAPLITELGIGELSYRAKGAREAGHLAIISGFAETAFTRASYPQLNTTIAHLRDVLGAEAYESLARMGETMTTADMVAYAYDQIDQAKRKLNAASK